MRGRERWRGREGGVREGGRGRERGGGREGDLGLGETVSNGESHLAMGVGVRGMGTECQLRLEHSLTL